MVWEVGALSNSRTGGRNKKKGLKAHFGKNTQNWLVDGSGGAQAGKGGDPKSDELSRITQRCKSPHFCKRRTSR